MPFRLATKPQRWAASFRKRGTGFSAASRSGIIGHGAVILLLLALACLGTACTAMALDATAGVMLGKGKARVSLAGHLEVLADPDGALNIDQVSSPGGASRFRPLEGDTVNQGITDATYWFRFSVRPARVGQAGGGSEGWSLYLDNPSMFMAQLYVSAPVSGDGWRRPQALDRGLTPVGMPNRFLVYRLPDPDRGYTVYLRVAAQPVLMFTPEILSEQALLTRYTRQILLFGVYGGTILALALYNLFIFFSIRDRAYLWYVLTIISFALLHTSLGGFLVLLAPHSASNIWAQASLFFLAVSAMCRAMFARHYLLTPWQAPRANRVLWLFLALFGVLAITSWLLPLRPLVLRGFSVLGTLFPLVLVVVGWLRWRGGFSPAKFFLLPYMFTGAGAVVMSLTVLNLIPWPHAGFVVHQIGEGLEAVLLSFALGYRIKTLQRQRAAAEQARQASEAGARRVMEAVPNPLLVCGPDRAVQYVNPAFAGTFGWERSRLDGRDWWTALGPGWEAIPSALDRALTQENVAGEHKLAAAGGGVVPVNLSAAAILDHRGVVRGVVLILRDITRHQQADRELRARQEQLRRLAGELSASEERQRRAIAEDLHDSVTQSLAGALFRLRLLNDGLPAGAADELDQSCQVLDQALSDTRTLTVEISPPVLYDLGLGPGLEWLAENMGERFRLKVGYAWDGRDPGLDDDLNILLYRSARELLINVHKHAGVDEAELALGQTDGMVTVTVADQGGGLACQGDDRPVGEGFGLFSIRQRLELLGGGMQMESGPGRGCRVTLHAPLNRGAVSGKEDHGHQGSAG